MAAQLGDSFTVRVLHGDRGIVREEADIAPADRFDRYEFALINSEPGDTIQLISAADNHIDLEIQTWDRTES